jgi:hypothetical protein
MQELCAALERFCVLLQAQKEVAAVAQLQEILQQLSQEGPPGPLQDQAIEAIVEAFEGEHELAAYTLHKTKDPEAWTEADELFLVSTEVWNLVRRLRRR